MSSAAKFLKTIASVPKNWTSEQAKDLDLWQRWDTKGRKPRELKPLMDRMNPLIYVKMRPFQTVQNIPPSAIKAEFQRHTISALEKYDPSKQVPLSYHVMRQMDGAKKFIYDYQNIGRIPSHRVRKIGDFKSTFGDLEQKYNRPPTAHELADKLKWPVKEVSRMTEELRDDLLPWKGSGAEQAFKMLPSRQKEVLDLIPYELDSQQKAVFEYVYGEGGKPALGTTRIAKVMKMSPSKVSKIKLEIANRMKDYLD
jgi:hypothetical protein